MTPSRTNPEPSASGQIDAIIAALGADWRGKRLAELRAIITAADPRVVEEVKWKKPSRPEGAATWSYEGILCVADILKSAVRLTFPKGARMKQSAKLFNARLDSTGVRALDVREADTVDAKALRAAVGEAIRLNEAARH